MNPSPFPPAPAWARAIRSAGVTGTNGKTTTTRWLAAALRTLAPGPVARVTTVGSYLNDELVESDADYTGFLSVLAQASAAGGRFAALECTSEALALGFAQAWPMEVGVFTNLSHDHLDAHRSFEHYLASKAQLFVALPPGGTAVLNAFDEVAPLLREVLPEGVRVLTYGVPSRAANPDMHMQLEPPDLLATAVQVGSSGTTLTLARHRTLALPAQLHVPIAGQIYAENALAALAGAIAMGAEPTSAALAIERAEPPPGRFEIVARNPLVIVDYAHTPDALARTLQTARELTTGEVTVVFGAGGNRDAAKRPKMGAAAANADRVILTSDNPRNEDPMQIILAIRGGLPALARTDLIVDRRLAIRIAVLSAAAHDIVVIAGKGHEATQTSRTGIVEFSDREIALAAHHERT